MIVLITDCSYPYPGIIPKDILTTPGTFTISLLYGDQFMVSDLDLSKNFSIIEWRRHAVSVCSRSAASSQTRRMKTPKISLNATLLLCIHYKSVYVFFPTGSRKRIIDRERTSEPRMKSVMTWSPQGSRYRAERSE